MWRGRRGRRGWRGGISLGGRIYCVGLTGLAISYLVWSVESIGVGDEVVVTDLGKKQDRRTIGRDVLEGLEC